MNFADSDGEGTQESGRGEMVREYNEQLRADSIGHGGREMRRVCSRARRLDYDEGPARTFMSVSRRRLFSLL